MIDEGGAVLGKSQVHKADRHECGSSPVLEEARAVKVTSLWILKMFGLN